MMKNTVAAIVMAVLILAGCSGTPQKKGLKVGTSPHGISLNWTQSNTAGVTSNNVYRSTASGQETLLFSSTSPITSYLDSSAVTGTTYFYEVTAVDSAAAVPESVKSNEVTATIAALPPTPAAPTGLSVTSAVAGIVIKWNPDAAGSLPIYYDVIRSVYVPGTSQPTATLNPSHLICTSYLDGTAKAGTRYMYWVRAWTTAGQFSPWSSGIAVTA
jgi:fibronectin type 3 domain-containing protein